MELAGNCKQARRARKGKKSFADVAEKIVRAAAGADLNVCLKLETNKDKENADVAEKIVRAAAGADLNVCLKRETNKENADVA